MPMTRYWKKLPEAFADTGCDAVYGDLQYVDAADTGKIVRLWKSGNYQPGDFNGAGCHRTLHFLYGKNYTRSSVISTCI